LAAAQGDEQAKVILREQFSEGAPVSSTSSCARCGVAGPVLKACARCKAVVYCSRECQAAHWKAGHKGSCSKSSSSTIWCMRLGEIQRNSRYWAM